MFEKFIRFLSINVVDVLASNVRILSGVVICSAIGLSWPNNNDQLSVMP